MANKESLKLKEYLILMVAIILGIAGVIYAITSGKEDKRKEAEKVTPIILKHPGETNKVLPQTTEPQPSKNISDKELSDQLAPGDKIDF